MKQEEDGMRSCERGHPVPDGFNDCAYCGPTGAVTGIQTGTNDHGVQAGQINGPVTINPEPREADPYAFRVEQERAGTRRSILPDNWVTAVAGTCTIVGFVSTQAGSSVLGPLSTFATILGFVSFFVLLASLVARFAPLQNGFLLPYIHRYYERSPDGTLYTSGIRQQCPWCRSNGRNNWMRPATVNGEIRWVCSANRQQHTDAYDPTAFNPPPIE